MRRAFFLSGIGHRIGGGCCVSLRSDRRLFFLTRVPRICASAFACFRFGCPSGLPHVNGESLPHPSRVFSVSAAKRLRLRARIEVNICPDHKLTLKLTL